MAVERLQILPVKKRRVMYALIIAVACFAFVILAALKLLLLFEINPPVPQSQIQSLQATYLRAEGPHKRGAAFSNLAMALAQQRLAGEMITEEQMVELLGPPDLMLRNDSEVCFAYFYDRFGSRDWVVVVQLRGREAHDRMERCI